MKIERWDKLGWGLVALIGSIALVLGGLGFITLFGTVAFIGIYIGIAGLIIAVVIRCFQVKLRLVIIHGVVGLIGALLAISLISFENFWWIFWCLALGLGVVFATLPLSLRNLRALTQPESARQEYVDNVGDKHFYVLTGYPNIQESDRSRLPTLRVLFVAVDVLLVLLVLELMWERAIDGATAATIWGSLGALFAAFGLIEAYVCLKVEQETGVEIFSQYLPDQAHARIGSELVTLLPKPVTWFSELLRDIWAAVRELYSVSVRK